MIKSRRLESEAFFVAAITLFGSFFRFYKLGFHSLWSDELTVWADTALNSFGDLIQHMTVVENSPPLYWILQYPFAHFLPQDEFGVRFLVALLGTLTVPAVYYFGRDVFGAAVGRIAAILFAVSYQAIYFSQEARAYSLLILLSALCGRYWFRIKNLDTRRADIILYIVFACGLMYTHVYGLLFVLAQALLFLFEIKNKKLLIRYFAIGGALTVLYLPWVPIILGQMKPQSVWFGPPEWLDVFAYHKFLFDRSSVYAILATLLCLALVYRERKTTRPILYLLGFGVIPFAMAFWRSRVATPMLFNRYMLIALPSTVVLTAAAIRNIETISRKLTIQKWTSRVLTTLFVAICIHTLFLRENYYGEQQKDRNREASVLASDLQKKYAAAIVITGKSEPIATYYFHLLKLDTTNLKFLNYDYSAADLLRVGRALAKPYFIFFSFSMHPRAETITNLDQAFERVEAHELPRSEHLYVYKIKN